MPGERKKGQEEVTCQGQKRTGVIPGEFKSLEVLNSEMGIIKFKISQVLNVDRDYVANLDLGKGCWNYGLETLLASFATVQQMTSKFSGLK